MESNNAPKLVGIYYNPNPHWVMSEGIYAVTIHCVGSLPKSVLERKLEFFRIEDSEKYRMRESVYFKKLELLLTEGHGLSPFISPRVRLAFNAFLENYKGGALSFRNWVIMPNHIHLITNNLKIDGVGEFKKEWKQFKLISTQFCNKLLNRSGRLWQRGQYDHWIRNEYEELKWREYLSKNPIEAKCINEGEHWVGLNA